MRAQGYVTAQDRLWQMDVLRRAGPGRAGRGLRRGRAARPTARCARSASTARPARRRPCCRRTCGTRSRRVRRGRERAHRSARPAAARVPPAALPPAAVDAPWTRWPSASSSRATWPAAGSRRSTARSTRTRLPPDVQDGALPDALPRRPHPLRRTTRAGRRPTAPPRRPRAAATTGSSRARTRPPGKPLLANDPHLGLGVPSIWTAVHLQAPDLDVAGVTLPGRAGRHHRTQPAHRVGLHERPRRRGRPVRGGVRSRAARPLPRGRRLGERDRRDREPIRVRDGRARLRPARRRAPGDR